MLFKVTTTNIKKSLKDFSIYFFTLVIAVSIFYAFNSVGSQESMLIMSESKRQMAKALVLILSYVSVFVSVILGFLIVYANNFLIKRRKKEIGLYLTLGMSKRKVSSIILLETFLIGLLSLAVGLGIGVVASQGMSLLTAKLFEADMTSFKFVFSGASCIKTIIYFGIIFLLVMIFNVVTLSRYKLIDLLLAKKKNEQIKKRNPVVVTAAFILTIVLYYIAYHLLLGGGLNSIDENVMLKMIASGAVGTLLLFYSLSSVLMFIIKKIKSFYYHKLNCFVLGSINSKINTTIISTTIISLMLLLTIGILSGSISMASVFNDGLQNNNRTDITINYFKSDYDEFGNEVENEMFLNVDLNEVINDPVFKKNISDYVYFNFYETNEVLADNLVTEKEEKKLRKTYGEDLGLDFPVKLMKISDYNNILKLYGEEEITLDNDEYLLTCNVSGIKEAYEDYYENNGAIKIAGNNLYPKTNKINEIAFFNANANANEGTIIVNDEYTNNASTDSIYLIANYDKDLDYEIVDNEMEDMLPFHGPISYSTKTEIEAASVGLKAIMIFLGLYLGIIFAISSATILAIGQLSDASDNFLQYQVLKRIGADRKDINRALFMQIGVIFMLPLAVAIIHAFFGLRELNTLLEMFGALNMMGNILLTALFIILVYGGYFIVTYLISKNIIKE